ncbi:MAG: DUF2726 domain-containing protein [Pseudomonadota bacterium]
MVELLFGSALGAVVAYLSLRLKTVLKLRRYRRADITSTDNQLRFIEGASLRPAAPINRDAFKVFRTIEASLPSRGTRYRLLAGVGMGAFIKTSPQHGNVAQRKRAFNTYSSKRVDFLIIDPFGRPALVVEYHDTGSHQANAAARDAVKQRALQKAGVELMEVYAHSDPHHYLQVLTHLLDRHESRHQWAH